MTSETTKEKIIRNKPYIHEKIKELSPWYHKIDLGEGIVTPGRDYDPIWNATRKTMNFIDYKGTRVLDIASWDGMWAFEAEARGAVEVIASDARLEGYRNLLFAREILKSNVIPLCNVPVQDLENRLNIVGLDSKFDIIHHLGLFYHLRDPLLSLAQVRKMLTPGGILVLETAYIDDDINSFMLFSGLSGKHHFYGISDTWAPTKRCLREILLRSDLEPFAESCWQHIKQQNIEFNGKEYDLGRITMLAKYSDTAHYVDKLKISGTQ